MNKYLDNPADPNDDAKKDLFYSKSIDGVLYGFAAGPDKQLQARSRCSSPMQALSPQNSQLFTPLINQTISSEVDILGNLSPKRSKIQTLKPPTTNPNYTRRRYGMGIQSKDFASGRPHQRLVLCDHCKLNCVDKRRISPNRMEQDNELKLLRPILVNKKLNRQGSPCGPEGKYEMQLLSRNHGHAQQRQSIQIYQGRQPK